MARNKIRFKKGDTVIAIAGKDKGKTGRVLRVFPQGSRAIVEGINFVKKHMRRTRQDIQDGGIIQKENPIKVSNLAVFCRSCTRPTRVGVTTLSDGSKSRFCRKCKEMI